MSYLQSDYEVCNNMMFIYYYILTDKRCSETTASLNSAGVEGMYEIYEMLCMRDAIEEAIEQDHEANKPKR